MTNRCVFCGEEIPEDQAICNTCPAILEGLPPDSVKIMRRILEDEEARIQLNAAIQEVERQIRIAIGPVVEALTAFFERFYQITEEENDGERAEV